MNQKSNKPKRVRLALTLGTAAFAIAAGVLASSSATRVDAIGDLNYYAGHNELSEVIDAAGKLNEQLAEEGMVLLKNDGELPLPRGSWVSVFGAHASGLNHGWTGKADLPDAITTVPGSLEAAGFKVNPTLKKFYEKNGKSGGGGAMSSGGYFDVEPTNFGGTEENSYGTYGDAAVIVLARIGGEGSDVSLVVNSEPVTELDTQEHVALGTVTEKDKDGNVIKTYQAHHALMLTKSEHELINHVKAHFNKICVVINSSNAMELGELKDDPAINGLLWMGAPGETGAAAVGRILVGDVNPSGRLVDEFPRDFTADPTWCNFGSQAQVGNVNHAFTEAGETYYVNDAVLGKSSDGTYTYTDYEEDIYLGYRYYETRYEDMYEAATDAAGREAATKWYNDHVAFAFGEGLSYTDFKFDILGLKAIKEGARIDVAGNLGHADLDSEVGSPAKIKKLVARVRVQNVCNFAGKEVVQIYVKAPYTSGKIEKAVHDIVGFGKTKILAPGQSQDIEVEFNVQDFASWDARDANNDTVKGDYELDAGQYTVRATSSSHVDLDAIKDEANRLAYDEEVFTLDANAHLHLDDFTDNPLRNLFTTNNGKYKDVDDKGRTMYNSERTADMMLNGADAMTKLSRANFEGTFPQKVQGRTIGEGDNEVKINGLTYVTDVTDDWEAYRTPRKDWHPAKEVDEGSNMDRNIRVYQQLKDEATDPWYISDEDLATLMAGWSQAAQSNPNNAIRFKDMRGVDWNDSKWNDFLNQLTWDELVSLFCESRASTPAIPSIGKAKSVDEDGPNNYENLFEWVDEPTIAATYNQELAEKEGELVGDMATLTQRVGWYGPGMDMHHTAFSGRNNEYYSQDGLQGGYIAAAVVRGYQSRGGNAMIKHLAFNDQDTNRGGQSNMVWTSEQNIRQYEIKMFQMAIQEGGARAGMSGYGRICGIVNQSNYRLNHNMLQDEWGWKGFMITDGFLGMRWCTTIDAMIRAGFQIQYKTEGAGFDWISGKWENGTCMVPADYEGNEADWVNPDTGKPVPVQVKTWKESKLQWYYARESAKSVLYSTVNSNNYENGMTEVNFSGTKDQTGTIQLADAKVGVNFEARIGLDLGMGSKSTVSYVLGDNAPAGLSINASGTISGKPTAEGTYRFSVSALIDGYIKKSANFQIKVVSAFAFAQGSDDLTQLKVNDEVFAQIESDVFTTKDNAYDEVKYSVQEGRLPAGLELTQDGAIQGTVTEAGVFHIVAKIEAKKTSSGGGGGWGGNPPFGIGPKRGPGGPGGGGGSTTTTETQTFAFDIIVAGGEQPQPQPVDPEITIEEQIAAIEAEIATLKTSLASATTDREAIEAQIAQLQSQLTELQSQLAAAKANSSEIDSLKSEIEQIKANQGSAKGCGSSIVGGSVLALAALGMAGLIISKKKED